MRVEKIHILLILTTNDTFCVSMGLLTVLESVLKDTLMCVEHNLGHMYIWVVTPTPSAQISLGKTKEGTWQNFFWAVR